MKERLSPRILEMLESIGQVAHKTGLNACVVGGFVRDMFLYRKNEDVDIVIEGDGIAFAKAFGKMHKARIHTHEKFGTAVIIFKDGFKIDVASARMEYYKYPAALPTVEMGSIKFDLFRRDFTINTLAIHLNPVKFGTLIDFFSAHRDIKGRVIRVLHNLTFVEDPTRIFRAIRFEQRFDFSIGKLTSDLIENAVKMDFFKRLSGRRVFTEIRLLLQEENPVPAIIRMEDYHLLKSIHPSIKLTKDMAEELDAVKKVMAWFDLLFLEESYMKWAVYFIALTRQCDKSTAGEICQRFELTPQQRDIVLKGRFASEDCLSWLEKKLPVQDSALFRKLTAYKTELVLSMMAKTKQDAVKKAISRYFTHLRYIQPLIKGKDLDPLGFSPGPIYGEILDAIHDAKLNGHLKTKAEEMEFAKKFKPV
jgi:tRNA nucleotidyltransferase (CCA-adding enzyme)